MEHEEKNYIKNLLDKDFFTEEQKKQILNDFPELAESEDERIRKKCIELIKRTIPSGNSASSESIEILECINWLKKQKEQTEELSTSLNGVMQEYVKAGKDEEEQEHRLKCYQLFWDALGDSEFFKQKEQKPVEKSINWTELTWKDIVELESIINYVHYEFRNGIGQESFGKEVLEKFREYKGDEYLEENEKEQKPVPINPDDKQMLERIMALVEFCNDKEIIWSWLCGKVKVAAQKPAEWSEDIIRKAIKEVGLTQHQINWFETNVFPPKQEWSGEDERYLIWLCQIIHSCVVKKELSLAEESKLGKWIDKWINHEPQPVQKWSEEDQKSLNCAINICISDFGEDCQTARFLKSLPKRFNLEPKQEWSEEDSDNLERVDNYLWMLDDYVGDDCAMPQGKTDKIRGNIQGILSPWLKSLPERFNLQPKQEWSEEDKRNLDRALFYTHDYERTNGTTDGAEECISWHKSLPLNFKKKNEDVAKLCTNEWSEDNIKELTEFEAAMLHIGMSFFGGSAGLNPNNTNEVKKQAKLLLELVPKQEWSKEDEKMLLSIINAFRNGTVSTIGQEQWLKNLPKRFNLKPKEEWSENDEKILDELLNHCNTENTTWYNWLKSISARKQIKK